MVYFKIQRKCFYHLLCTKASSSSFKLSMKVKCGNTLSKREWQSSKVEKCQWLFFSCLSFTVFEAKCLIFCIFQDGHIMLLLGKHQDRTMTQHKCLSHTSLKIIFTTYLVREKYKLCFIFYPILLNILGKMVIVQNIEKYYVVFLEHLPI